MSSPLNYISIAKNANDLQYHLVIPPPAYLHPSPLSQAALYIFSLPIPSLLIELNISDKISLSEDFISIMKVSLNQLEEIIMNINIIEDNASNLEDLFVLLKSLEHQRQVKRIMINIFGRIENKFLVFLLSKNQIEFIQNISIILDRWLLEFENLENLSIDFYLPDKNLRFPGLKKLEFTAENIFLNDDMKQLDEIFFSKFNNLLVLKINSNKHSSANDILIFLIDGLRNNCPFLVDFGLDTYENEIHILDRRLIDRLFEFSTIIENKKFLIYLHFPLIDSLYHMVGSLGNILSNDLIAEMEKIKLGAIKRKTMKRIVVVGLLIKPKSIFKRKEIDSDLIKVIFGI
jgi:hypothetical protein